MSDTIRVLFICTANAAPVPRWRKASFVRNTVRVLMFFSAGTHPSRVSTRAIEVMHEIGIDISHHQSKTLDEISGMTFDLAVTLCTMPTASARL